MVFSSLLFLYAFFPLSLLAYFLCRSQKAENTALLIFSLVFYAWGEPLYVFLLMYMALIAWLCALCIEASPSRPVAKFWLVIAIVLHLSAIGFFKYSGFLCSVFGEPPEFIKNIALPIGISFYTFQLLTYVVDIYRGEASAQESYWNVLLYACLFHQCIAGPIVRYKSIEQELFVSRRSRGNLLSGIKRFAIGLAKKTLLANPCGGLADSLLAGSSVELQSISVLSGWIGMVAYMLQIYLDFSAYSDMAIGMGRMLGLHYPENFNYPYIARSVTEFWRRWHISLSTFFRDYVYIPLGGNRCSKWRNILNLFIVWSLTGLWHGASWNYVFWGLYFFLFLVVEKYLIKDKLDRFPIIGHIYLLLVVFFGWIIFRFSDIASGVSVFRSLFGLNGNSFADFVSGTVLLNNSILLIVCAFVCTPCGKNAIQSVEKKLEAKGALSQVWEVFVSVVFPILLLVLSTATLVGDTYNPFIYFQF